jgi:hypothetical protein
VAHEYDTAERDLDRAGIKLSRHPSEAGVDWRLTRPSGEHVEAWEPGTSGLSPPPEVMQVIEEITAGKELVPAPAPCPEPHAVPADEYGRFEELARRLVRRSPSRPSRAEFGAT